MSNTTHVFSLDALQAQVAAEAAQPAARSAPTAATPAPASSASTAASAATPTPERAPTASEPRGEGYVDLDTWRIDDAEPTPQPSAATGDGAETRYRVLKGKYDAEVPRLQARVRELETLQSGAPPASQDAGTLRQLQTRIDTLTSELEGLRGSRGSQVPAAAPGADYLPDPEDDDLAFEYGDAGARVIRDLRQQVSTLQQQTDARIGSIEARDATRTRDAFRGQLVQRLGEDRIVFDEPGWSEFVQQRNPYVAGKSYNASLIDADAAGDLDTIVNIVQAYRQFGGTATNTDTQNNPFDALAVPARVQATGAPVAGQRFRGSDLDLMVKKWQRGEKSFAELQSFERAFTTAQQAGRVDP
jgi:hypothetical protein